MKRVTAIDELLDQQIHANRPVTGCALVLNGCCKKSKCCKKYKRSKRCKSCPKG